MGIMDAITGKKPAADPNGAQAPGGDSSIPDLATLAKQARQGRAARRGKRGPSPEELEAEERAKLIDELFDGENWEEVAGLYFEARYAWTGWEGFRLNERQKALLGKTLSTAGKTLCKIDPAYIALIVFTANFGGLIVDKELQYRRAVQLAEERRAAKGTAS